MLVPQIPDTEKLPKFEEIYREQLLKDFNRWQGTRTFLQLASGGDVWITDLKRKGTAQIQHRRPGPWTRGHGRRHCAT